MNILALAENRIGGRWTGATLHFRNIPKGRLVRQDMWFI
jgi:hypothetical protein